MRLPRGGSRKGGTRRPKQQQAKRDETKRGDASVESNAEKRVKKEEFRAHGVSEEGGVDSSRNESVDVLGEVPVVLR